MTEWYEDKSWSDPYLEHTKRLLGTALIIEGDAGQDRLENSDLVVVRLEPYRIGVRIRRAWCFDIWPDQFTIRSARDSGATTELAKILDGWGDYLFYGFAHPNRAGRLQAARLIDLDTFREWEADAHFQEKDNGDGTYFRAYPISAFPRHGVRASWGHFAHNE